MGSSVTKRRDRSSSYKRSSLQKPELQALVLQSSSLDEWEIGSLFFNSEEMRNETITGDNLLDGVWVPNLFKWCFGGWTIACQLAPLIYLSMYVYGSASHSTSSGQIAYHDLARMPSESLSNFYNTLTGTFRNHWAALPHIHAGRRLILRRRLHRRSNHSPRRSIHHLPPQAAVVRHRRVPGLRDHPKALRISRRLRDHVVHLHLQLRLLVAVDLRWHPRDCVISLSRHSGQRPRNRRRVVRTRWRWDHVNRLLLVDGGCCWVESAGDLVLHPVGNPAVNRRRRESLRRPVVLASNGHPAEIIITLPLVNSMLLLKPQPL
ncbi:Glycerol-3-phosphate dehydrogenase [NAD(P)+] [Striga asiatica]|uniref:Glycerol-3-phosphate dehydrogenase [NAD(P)+] n=1 Tax=Striga asiatica TaxID=4170 RepID=A0A5A7QEC1_STRAF|nr:Glycerol-3-phosphate dehydrogenase [NAD(P)+] [Striga asiatica]